MVTPLAIEFKNFLATKYNETVWAPTTAYLRQHKIAYPDGDGRAWNVGGGCCGAPGRDLVEEVAEQQPLAAHQRIENRRIRLRFGERVAQPGSPGADPRPPHDRRRHPHH